MQLSYSEISRLKEIANEFQIVEGEITHVIKVDGGRINSTYKITVTCENDTMSYMLQRINVFVFNNAEEVMKNAISITNHLRSKGMETLEFVMTKDGEPLFYCDEGVFRMTKFIHAEIFQAITRPKDMYNLGLSVGYFSMGLSDFEAQSLFDTIPNFHNTSVRYDNFLISTVNNVLRAKNNRVKEAEEEVKFINANREIYSVIVNALMKNDIPLRVTHNDTKLNNVLFDRKTNIPRCLIDLDTVMSGSVLFDIADAIRSGANVSTEDERQFFRVKLDLNLVKEFLKGFKAGAPNFLTAKEIELLPISIKIITMELGMRYLTDYFDGDVYFNITNPDDNLVRARVQFALTKDIDAKMNQLKEIVKDIFI